MDEIFIPVISFLFEYATDLEKILYPCNGKTARTNYDLNRMKLEQRSAKADLLMVTCLMSLF